MSWIVNHLPSRDIPDVFLQASMMKIIILKKKRGSGHLSRKGKVFGLVKHSVHVKELRPAVYRPGEVKGRIKVARSQWWLVGEFCLHHSWYH